MHRQISAYNTPVWLWPANITESLRTAQQTTCKIVVGRSPQFVFLRTQPLKIDELRLLIAYINTLSFIGAGANNHRITISTEIQQSVRLRKQASSACNLCHDNNSSKSGEFSYIQTSLALKVDGILTILIRPAQFSRDWIRLRSRRELLGLRQSLAFQVSAMRVRRRCTETHAGENDASSGEATTDFTRLGRKLAAGRWSDQETTEAEGARSRTHSLHRKRSAPADGEHAGDSEVDWSRPQLRAPSFMHPEDALPRPIASAGDSSEFELIATSCIVERAKCLARSEERTRRGAGGEEENSSREPLLDPTARREAEAQQQQTDRLHLQSSGISRALRSGWQRPWEDVFVHQS